MCGPVLGAIVVLRGTRDVLRRLDGKVAEADGGERHEGKVEGGKKVERRVGLCA